MCRLFFKLFRLTYVICSIIILNKIFSGQVYVRTPPSGLVSETNDSIDVSELWPFKMHLGIGNYWCNVPSPNIDVTEESLIDAWYLPPKTRLSPLMRQIGQCHLAAEEMESKGIEFDCETNCNCVDSWPITVLAVVLFCLIFNIYRLVFGFPIDNAKEYKDLKWLWIYVVTFIPFGFWFIAERMVVYYLSDKSDIGLSYTAYGDLYPTSYYLKTADWKPIHTLVSVAYFLNGFELIFCMLSSCCSVSCSVWCEVGTPEKKIVKPEKKPVIATVSQNVDVGEKLKMIV